ncbi:MAG: hypothetical protein RLZZ262_773 [Bacteroidota bacterium]|jgi:activator of HSP90 ATPase
MKIKTDNIFKVIELDIQVDQAYKSLLDGQLLAKLIGKKMEIDPKVGGIYSGWDKKSHGFFTYMDKNRRFAMTWSHTEFPEGQFSTVIFDFESTENGCRISFNHIGVPEEDAGWLTETWKNDYWTPIQEHFAVNAAVKA